MSTILRRQFVRKATVALGTLAAGRIFLRGPLQAQTGAARSPALDLELVKKFVAAAHTKLDDVKAMLDAEPHLVNATWDWGGGDFETGLGGASHMGRPDIASYLLEKGARMDVFCATMMGKMEIVKACVADTPGIVHVKGPHGITLLRHAVMGKQEALVKVLMDAGAT
ncbi:MAG TPA: ankyrin repeat domain-containing protein [Gemmatimonadaceae bacterium]|nr:ankyrin repeat domain-containing protein [Gemmatimonadaceae bacterium]